MESSSKINVYFRKKPYFPINENDKDIISLTDTSINIQNCKKRVNDNVYFSSYKNLDIIDDQQKNKDVFSKTIYKDISDLKSNLLIAYGQTGSGKTHTLTGTKDELGLIPLAVDKLLNDDVCLELSVLEIYNDQIYDLLEPSKRTIEIFECNNRIKYKHKPTKISINNHDDLNKTINRINSLRKVGNTKLNDASSRAHTIYFFNSKSDNFKFFAIDLAGNERGRLTNAKGVEQNREYIAINKSLFALKECIRSIYLSKPYIPFRHSKLTKLLKEILYNNINIHFIGTINSSKICYPDIVDTIEYGMCLKKSNIKKILRNDIPEKPLVKPIYTKKDDPNIYLSIKDLSKSQNIASPENEHLVKRCKSAPTIGNSQLKNDILDNYYEYILYHYNVARKHSRIYDYLKKNNGYLDHTKSKEIQKIINKFTCVGMKFIDNNL
tara:strand:+ start:3324 stop:4637 length:1314 start_codon:yes stop_codon:yes gene_type:complete